MNQGLKMAIIDNLQEAPGEIHEAAMAALTAQRQTDSARKRLLEEEAKLLPTLDGKNAEIRKGQLYELTKGIHEDIAFFEEEYRRSCITLDLRQNEFRAAQAIARLLAGND